MPGSALTHDRVMPPRCRTAKSRPHRAQPVCAPGRQANSHQGCPDAIHSSPEKTGLSRPMGYESRDFRPWAGWVQAARVDDEVELRWVDCSSLRCGRSRCVANRVRSLLPATLCAVKSPSRTDVDVMVAEATLDCYNDSECVTGFYTMIDEHLEVPFRTEVLGSMSPSRASTWATRTRSWRSAFVAGGGSASRSLICRCRRLRQAARNGSRHTVTG